ncbi:hypothetical protein AB0M02_43850 [Actinoplanes sp. NPDC051861]|uniref:hypothetical protein n=1 Tax=Actinoplanes sp. NPDC051861 TaxID=3155170 RepID=UPI00341404FA
MTPGTAPAASAAGAAPPAPVPGAGHAVGAATVGPAVGAASTGPAAVGAASTGPAAVGAATVGPAVGAASVGPAAVGAATVGPAVGAVAVGPAVGVAAVGPVSGAARIVGVTLGHRTLAEADHWIQSLSPPPVLACTHLLSSPFPHVAISLLALAPIPSSPELQDAAAAAASGQSGRAVRFPGVERLTGELTVSEILQRSSIARVDVLGSGPASPGTIVETGDFVRPQFQAGELVLVTTPAAGDRLVPFERRDPTPCCADH